MALHWQIWLPVVGASRAHPFDPIFAKVAGCPESDAPDAALPYLEGAGNLFTRMMDELYALAGLARNVPPDFLSGGDHANLIERLDAQPETATFARR
jgi:hypothetical protein